MNSCPFVKKRNKFSSFLSGVAFVLKLVFVVASLALITTSAAPLKVSAATSSQIKIIAKDKTVLDDVRKKIESMGFLTYSVVDTVSQINSLFGTARVVLGALGAVALGVASLGMFNTLTVSLLERTREVGLMKAMGMSSGEVKRLFLTESMIMGFLGGILGIFLGFLGGKLFSLVLSVFSLLKGAGFIDISRCVKIRVAQ